MNTDLINLSNPNAYLEAKKRCFKQDPVSFNKDFQDPVLFNKDFALEKLEYYIVYLNGSKIWLQQDNHTVQISPLDVVWIKSL